MARIPFFPQKNQFYCGPAIMQMILASHGIKRSQRQLAFTAKTNRHTGTTPTLLLKTLEKEGLQVRAGERKNLSQIKKALERDEIVIVLFIEAEKEWDHYAIVSDIRDGKVNLLDPDARTGHTSMVEEEFLRRWRDRDVAHTQRWAAFVDGSKNKPTVEKSAKRLRR